MFLLDANLLIALGDSSHAHADAALRFFGEHARRSSWATCPLTENAFLRILGRPDYPGGPGTTEAARRMLLSITANPGHEFWPDQLSLLTIAEIPRLPGSKHLTDLYLLALAVRHKAQLVTFDRRIDPTLIPGGVQAYLVLSCV